MVLAVFGTIWVVVSAAAILLGSAYGLDRASLRGQLRDTLSAPLAKGVIHAVLAFIALFGFLIPVAYPWAGLGIGMVALLLAA